MYLADHYAVRMKPRGHKSLYLQASIYARLSYFYEETLQRKIFCCNLRVIGHGTSIEILTLQVLDVSLQ